MFWINTNLAEARYHRSLFKLFWWLFPTFLRTHNTMCCLVWMLRPSNRISILNQATVNNSRAATSIMKSAALGIHINSLERLNDGGRIINAPSKQDLSDVSGRLATSAACAGTCRRYRLSFINWPVRWSYSFVFLSVQLTWGTVAGLFNQCVICSGNQRLTFRLMFISRQRTWLT